MKSNSLNGKKSHNKENTIFSKLSKRKVNVIARASGFLERISGKITPWNFLSSFLTMVSKQENTFDSWAAHITMLCGKAVSRQAVEERMTPEAEAFVTQVLQDTMSEQAHAKICKKQKGLLAFFKGIFIDDSTTISLPDELAQEFPGNISRGKQKAQAKIHALYNIKEKTFDFLHIHSFSDNDQSLSANVLPHLKAGDLSLRDLGFMVLSVLKEFINQSIYFISRKGYKTNVYDIQTEKEIDLLKELRKKKFIDREVHLGAKEKIPVRLVALPISTEQAAERRRKAKNDRDKRLNHSDDYYELLGYSIYVTNIEKEICSAAEIYLLYKLRWQIEIIFKSWKSCFALEKLFHRQCTNAIRVRCSIIMMLLYIYLFQIVWWRYCEIESKQDSQNERFSILKMAKFFNTFFLEILTSNSAKLLMLNIKNHCMYDKRKDRINAKEFELKLAA